MKENLFIYGNSGLGQSLIYLIETIPNIRKNWNNIFFLNDYEQKPILDYPTITFENSLILKKEKESDYIIALGEPTKREDLYLKCKKNKLSFATINGSPQPLARSTTLKEGCIIHFGTIIDVNVTIGRNCFINKNTSIGHDVIIEDSCVISPNCTIGGFTQIGNLTYIGSGATIRDRLKIGKNCIIGMGAVVTKDIPDNQVVVGNPAKFLRNNNSKIVFKNKQ